MGAVVETWQQVGFANDTGDGITGRSYGFRSYASSNDLQNAFNGSGNLGRYINAGETWYFMKAIQLHAGTSPGRCINFHDVPAAGFSWGSVSPVAFDLYPGTAGHEVTGGPEEVVLEYSSGCAGASGHSHWAVPMTVGEWNYLYIAVTFKTDCTGAIKIYVQNSTTLTSAGPVVNLSSVRTLNNTAGWFPGCQLIEGHYVSSGFTSGANIVVDQTAALMGSTWQAAYSDTPAFQRIWGQSTRTTFTNLTPLDRATFKLPDDISAALGGGGGGSPTVIGDSAVEAGTDAGAANFVDVQGPYLCSASGTVTSGQARFTSRNSGDSKRRVLVYADNAGVPGALVAVSAEFTIPNLAAAAWYTASFASFPVTAGLKYWVGYWYADNLANSAQKVGGGGEYFKGAVTYSGAGAPPDPFPGGATASTSIDSVYLVVTPGVVPANTIAPAVTSGVGPTLPYGSILSCSTGSWTNSPTSYHYQWYRCARLGGSRVPVGTDSSQYTLVSADLLHTLQCDVTATNASGSSAASASNLSNIVDAPGQLIPDGSVESEGFADWGPNIGAETVSQDTGTVYGDGGGASLKFITPGAANFEGVFWSKGGGFGAPAAPGQRITFRGQLQTTVAGKTLRCAINEYDGTGAFLRTQTPVIVPTTGLGVWDPVTVVSNVGANTSLVKVSITTGTSTQALTGFVDGTFLSATQDSLIGTSLAASSGRRARSRRRPHYYLRRPEVVGAPLPPPPPVTRSSVACGPLPWLVFNDVEVSNADRTLAYLRKGLAAESQGNWIVSPYDPCTVMSRWPGAPLSFVTPALDPAPWYNPAETGSTEFLGFVLLDIQGYDSTIQRSVTQRRGGLGGGILGGQTRKARQWKFRGALVSATDRGAEWGLRWLTHVLQTTECAECEPGTLQVRLTCPPDDGSADEEGLWLSTECALVDGPLAVEPWGPKKTQSSMDNLGMSRTYSIVEFTMVAANPWLYKPPVACLDVEWTQAGSCAGTYISAVLGDGATQFLRLVEPSGVTAHDYQAVNNGTFVGAMTFGQPTLVPQDAGLSAQFAPANSNRITTALPLANGKSYTFEGWSLRQDQTAEHILAASDVSGTHQMVLSLASGSNNVGFWSDRASAGVTWAGSGIVGTAFHWALTWVGGTKTAELFINGVSQGTRVLGVDINASAGNLVWAGQSTLAVYYKGRLADLAFYPSVVPAASLLTHYQLGVGQIAFETICDYLFGRADQAFCCTVAPPPMGVLAANFTISTVGGSGELIFETRTGSCSGPVAQSMTISEIPAHSVLQIDSSQHSITLTTTDPITGAVTVADGFPYLTLPADLAFSWMEVRDCDATACLCVRPALPCANTDMHVVVETQYREA